MKKHLFTPRYIIVFLCLFLFQFESIAKPITLRVLTLNTWLLPFVAKDIDSRLTLIPYFVKESKAHIVFFQEIWVTQHRDKLIKDLKNLGYKYSAWGDKQRAAFGGNGLLIVSQFELNEKSFQSMAFSNFTRGDEQLVKKGALKTLVKIPEVGSVELYNTHLGATTYDAKEGKFKEEEVGKRSTQLKELIKWIEQTRNKELPFILAGDFNNHWQVIQNGRYENKLSIDYELLTDKKMGLGLLDCYREANGMDAMSGFTTDVKANPYCNNPLDAALKNQPNVVDDYIFISPLKTIKVAKTELLFKEPIDEKYKETYKLPTLPKRLSDHYGVLLHLEFN